MEADGGETLPVDSINELEVNWTSSHIALYTHEITSASYNSNLRRLDIMERISNNGDDPLWFYNRKAILLTSDDPL